MISANNDSDRSSPSTPASPSNLRKMPDSASPVQLWRHPHLPPFRARTPLLLMVQPFCKSKTETRQAKVAEDSGQVRGEAGGEGRTDNRCRAGPRLTCFPFLCPAPAPGTSGMGKAGEWGQARRPFTGPQGVAQASLSGRSNTFAWLSYLHLVMNSSFDLFLFLKLFY